MKHAISKELLKKAGYTFFLDYMLLLRRKLGTAVYRTVRTVVVCREAALEMEVGPPTGTEQADLSNDLPLLQ